MLAGMRAPLAILLACLLGSAGAADPIFREVRPDGSVHFTDKPPNKHAKPIDIGPISGTIPGNAKQKPAIFYTPEALRHAARFTVRVESPTPGQVGTVDQDLIAAASVMPGLVKGFRLVYQVNGRAVTTQPIEDLSVPLPALAAGAHELVVVLLDPQGREIARSETSRFLLRPLPESARRAP